MNTKAWICVFVAAAGVTAAAQQPARRHSSASEPAPLIATFETSAAAADALVAAARDFDVPVFERMFGPEFRRTIASGEPAQDRERAREFAAKAAEKTNVSVDPKTGARAVVLVGDERWPFPIPIVKKGQSWMFDTEQGKQEVLNRRIGGNELFTIQTMLAIVDAEREYAIKDRDRNGLLEYAQKFLSDPGKKNGLYWEAKSGEPESPLGPIMVQARSQGYGAKITTAPGPYHGYNYRILTAQGKDAPGGAYSYLVKGKMIGGFAVVAYPAEYGNSGIMTFIVNYDGKVFQKNLGPNTAAAAKSMKEYNPDKTWTEVKQ